MKEIYIYIYLFIGLTVDERETGFINMEYCGWLVVVVVGGYALHSPKLCPSSAISRLFFCWQGHPKSSRETKGNLGRLDSTHSTHGSLGQGQGQFGVCRAVGLFAPDSEAVNEHTHMHAHTHTHTHTHTD